MTMLTVSSCLVLCILIAQSHSATAKTLSCPTPQCDNRCPNGYQVSSEGCDTCDCIQPEKLSLKCPQPICSERCDNGYRKTKGCVTCECYRPVELNLRCATPQCENPCPHGYFRDSNGCNTCDCIEPELY